MPCMCHRILVHLRSMVYSDSICVEPVPAPDGCHGSPLLLHALFMHRCSHTCCMAFYFQPMSAQLLYHLSHGCLIPVYLSACRPSDDYAVRHLAGSRRQQQQRKEEWEEDYKAQPEVRPEHAGVQQEAYNTAGADVALHVGRGQIAAAVHTCCISALATRAPQQQDCRQALLSSVSFQCQ